MKVYPRLPSKPPGGTAPLGIVLPLLVIGLTLMLQSEALSQPPKVTFPSAAYDAAHNRTVFFGGIGNVSTNECWALSITDTVIWDSLTFAGPSPSPRFGHSAIYDPVRGEMVVFGGRSDAGALDETWVLSLADPQAWSQLGTSQGPTARFYHSAVYDPLRRRMWIFGGFDPDGSVNDTWALPLGDTARWDIGPYVGRPLRHQQHSAIYDPIRDRMIVYGGFPPTTTNNVWALSLADTQWSVIRATGTPAHGRVGHTAIYDPIGDRMIVFGGRDSIGQRLNDVWELSLSVPAWKRLLPVGGPPEGRAFHSAVYDSSLRAMVVFGGNHDGNDNTWALSLGPVPMWSPARPDIHVSTSDLQLPTVMTVGDTVSVPISIINMGLESLYLGPIAVPSDEFRLDTPLPPKLLPKEEAPRTLRLVARVPRPAGQDSLVIESNDPVTPRKRVTFGIHVLGLEFQTRVLDTPAEVPLGVTFIVVVTPATDVHVEGGTLFYRKAGSSSPFDSVAITPLATDFIAPVPAASVTESGVEYYVQVHNGLSIATSAVVTQAVAAAASLNAVPRPTSGTDFLVDRDIEVEVLLPPGAGFVSGHIHYREGGAQDYETDTVTAGVLGRPVARIPARVVGPRGVEYWIEVQTLRSDLRFPATAPEPAFVRTRVQSLAEETEHPGGRYRLLSVPLDFGADFSGSLGSILTDQLGTYDPVQWRAYWYDPDSLRNFEFSTANGDWFRPEPGRGFWLISLSAHRVNTAPIAGFSTSTAHPDTVVLAPGWNQIGNPFDFPVAWADVARDTAAVGAPVAFDPSRGKIGEYSDAVPFVLVPFEGYFVENVALVPETLLVPPRAAAIAEPALASSEAGLHGRGVSDRAIVPASASGRIQAASDRWSFRLEARSAVAADGSNVFGVQPEAADDFDPLDLRKPPRPPGPWVRLAFAHPDWRAMPGQYRHDLRAPGIEGHTWEVELLSGTAGEVVTLELSALTALPAGLALRVLDRELGSLSDPLGVAAQLPVVSFGPKRPYRLAIIAGSDDYVRHASDLARTVPVGLTMDHGAPNPFRAATRIRFGLPRAAQVSMEVYSVLGERVATLMDRTPLEPGYHAVLWDGTRSNGGPVPSGVYLVRLVAGGEVRSGRLVLVR